MKRCLVLILLISMFMLLGCQTPVEDVDKQEQSADTVELWTIESQKVDCVGVGPMKCMIVNGKNFYDTIDGFAFEPGYTYELKVDKVPRPEPIPADASSYTYTLVEIVSKKADIPDNCISWFDGCNNCIVQEGEINGCTRKYCPPEAMEEPRCLETA